MIDETMKCLRCGKDSGKSKYSGKLPLCFRCEIELGFIGINLNQYVQVKSAELLEVGKRLVG